MNDTDKALLIAFTALVWNYGDVFVDDAEIETHVVKVSHEDFLNFGIQELEVLHDDMKKVTYYRVRKLS